jgi:glyoxylase-like metal-dependent hydrolase (beta-lactamase superfamily II)
MRITNGMKIRKIEFGNFQVDGGAAFGVVPKKVWKKRYPCDEENYCRVAMRSLLVDTGNKLILIDTGSGEKQLEYLKFFELKDMLNVETAFASMGYKCEDVTDVVLTHLHFDHCGGCTRYNNTTSTYDLVFPNATHWVGKKQWDNFINPNVREADSYFSENMIPVEQAGKLKFVSENQWICPEFEIRLFDGHTLGQIVSYIYAGENTYVYLGDVIPLMANIPLAWISSYDILPISAMEAKKEILNEAVMKNQILVFEHDMHNVACTVHKVLDKYRVGDMLQIE